MRLQCHYIEIEQRKYFTNTGSILGDHHHQTLKLSKLFIAHFEHKNDLMCFGEVVCLREKINATHVAKIWPTDHFGW